MKSQIITAGLFLLIVNGLSAQYEFYNNNATVHIGNTATLFVKGSFTNAGTTPLFDNNGTLQITGNIQNSQVFSNHKGSLVLQGNAVQTVNGTAAWRCQHLTINNGNTLHLNTPLEVSGTAQFISGIVTTLSKDHPLLFTATGNHSSASDQSHVNGFVVKLGTGVFSYPVGDGIKLQKIDINSSINSNGMRVQYLPSDAGILPFGPGGAGANLLKYYNEAEHWNVEPLGTATGKLTLYWDDYNNAGIASIADVRVAHKTNTHWLNEDATAVSGTIFAGSVTSGTISNWSPFTLGSISSNSTLPLVWISFQGRLTANKNAQLNWSVNEYQVAGYSVEKSTDGRSFKTIAQLQGKGDGTNSYSFLDHSLEEEPVFYKIKQTDQDGRFSYSPAIQLRPFTVSNSQPVVYPNPFNAGFTVTTNKAEKLRLLGSDGKLLQQYQLQAGTNYLPAATLCRGHYLLQFENGKIIQVTKQ
ncbi:T9SS type A sorting domain-containing protein [Flavihumibacter sp. CACIAM 22H1]|uniref:T9SS type A sorting domain-containing protein n=1 Tax=Flavihumibacter sp. CACIAM 22H1 TaxID=1812911 RepID=UPI0007A821B1|nr:T9SS type A sorting domain-containing protein [Flavihumibacter sp. CACIAM 22H1]KYP14505.1 MAG: hypothetical protein A1D16_15370 [Flavihumibacter sp. CACIAM 22H1]